jgi:hypothetical protein
VHAAHAVARPPARQHACPCMHRRRHVAAHTKPHPAHNETSGALCAWRRYTRLSAAG